MAIPVFLGYDREALDREYNNRAKVPDAQARLDWYARESEATRKTLPCRLGVAYGPHPGERLDVFFPAGSGGLAAGAGPAPGRGLAPIQLFVHGGYWHRMDKADFDYVARAFQPAGALTVVINYALIPTVDMDELVRQCRAATAWTWEHAAELGADPERLFVSGHSAGGHLVAMLLATDWPDFGRAAGARQPLPPDLVRGGCAISGLYDLEPIRLCYLNDVLGLTPEAARRHSPALLTPPRPQPLLAAVGALEGPEYHRQTETLARAWRGHGVPVEVMDMAGHDHFSIVAELGDPATTLARAIHRQMGLG